MDLTLDDGLPTGREEEPQGGTGLWGLNGEPVILEKCGENSQPI